MLRLLRLALVTALCWTAMPQAAGQIERLDLDQIVARTDNAVFGEVTAKTVFRETDPRDGSVNYYTRVRLEGRSLHSGRALVVDVLYLGGFLNEREGVWNSESPSESDTAVGQRLVVFYKWLDDVGGGVAGNLIYGLHGGLYRTVQGPKGRVVLGRGEGYAVRANTRVGDLDAAIRTIARSK